MLPATSSPRYFQYPIPNFQSRAQQCPCLHLNAWPIIFHSAMHHAISKHRGPGEVPAFLWAREIKYYAYLGAGEGPRREGTKFQPRRLFL